jgi:predicted alpha/beta-hydrolase family hydrolase
MSSQYLATQPAIDVRGIIFFGFPLHQPKKPSIERAEHLQRVKVPMLFLQGTRDELASYDLVVEVCDSLRLATLTTIEGANHAFKAGKQDIMPKLADACSSWITKKIKVEKGKR